MQELSARDERTIAFARSELTRVLRTMSLRDLSRHVRLDLVPKPDTQPLRGLQPDGFAILPEGSDFRIAARTPRALVYGAFAFLESLGCRWYFPGKEGEFLPAQPLAPSRQVIVENPETPRRSLVAFWDRTGPGVRQRVREYLDFAVRARYNRFYLHWPTDIDAIAALAREHGHGLDIGVKLHIARELLPTTHFRTHPEWFRLENGKRTPDHNLCVSNPQGLAEVTRNAQALAERLPVDLTDLAYWQDDVPNAWCQCPSCAGLSSSEQNLRLMAAILKGVQAARPGARLSYLAYLATGAPPESAKLPKGLFLEYAPYAACYRHALDDPDCPKNSLLLADLGRNLARFPLDSARVFEYWLDLALFSSYRRPVRRLPLHPERMAHDVAYYRRLGLPEIENVQWMPPRDAVGTPEVANPDYALLPRLLWNPKQDIAGYLREFATNYYGTARAADVLDLIAQVDRANPRRVCTEEARGDGPKQAARLLKRAIARCATLEGAATGRHQERLAGLRATLTYDLSRAEAGDV
jgi:hypothetical protein